MRTTIVIDPDLLNQALHLTKAKTKREVVELALRDLIRKQCLARLKERAGTVEMNLTPRQLAEIRNLG